eukprot:TRINITY_DN4547_c0_g2_i1.p1 TRINITY_DN4547_c0_g2~~TRINITY_DN4547_c0_g2_i1.p1  ORF type:complete len:689 (-),score=134.21 TRINITY_DN4547_c0_g2_i1:839-2905(-)
MSCPFLNPSKRDTFIKKSHVEVSHPDVQSHINTFSDHLSIRDLIVKVMDALELSHYMNQDELLEDILSVFYDQWIFSWKELKMMDIELLGQLDIPVVILQEIERIVLFYQAIVKAQAEETVSVKKRTKLNTDIIFKIGPYSDNDVFLMKGVWLKLRELPEDDNFNMTRKFYDRFLEINDTGRRLFEGRSMDEQATTLFKMMNWIVMNLDNREDIVKEVRHSGGRHTIYGVGVDDFIPFIETFCTTLRSALGKEIVTDDVYNACVNVLTYLAKEMLIGARGFETGECFRISMYDEDLESMQDVYFRLTVDRLIQCKDGTYSESKKEWTLKGLQSFERIRENQFDIHSLNPPFTLRLEAHDDEQLKKLEEGFEWRIKALKRISSVSTTPRTPKSKSLKSDREILHRAWQRILERDQRGNVNTEKTSDFFETLFKRLTSLSPVARDLLGGKPFLRHLPALTRMLALIIRDDPPESLLQRTGGFHVLIGVKQEDYNLFAIALCDALHASLGDEVTIEVRDAFYNTVMNLGEIMDTLGKRLKAEGPKITAYKRKHGGWVSVGLLITLTDLNIYKGSSYKSFMGSISFGSILEVDVDENDIFEKPSDYCVSLTLKKKPVFLCFEDAEEMKTFIREAKWRMKGAQYREIDEVDDVLVKSTSTGRLNLNLSRSTSRKRKFSTSTVFKGSRKFTTSD